MSEPTESTASLDAQSPADDGIEDVVKARRLRFLQTWFTRLSPWVSLLMSSVGAVYMDRGEDQGTWIVAFAALSFAALVTVALAHRPRRTQGTRHTGHFHKLVRFGTLAGSQSLVQTSLFFSAPFYVQACAYTVGQCLFMAALAFAVLISLWDPWCERVLLDMRTGAALLSFSSFAAWNVALPMLGLQHRRAIWFSAVAVAVAMTAFRLFHQDTAKNRLKAIVPSAVVPLLLAAFGLTLLPAAPLKIVELGIGSAVSERALVGKSKHFAQAPDKLWCLSAVFAPRGLNDDLVHEWSRDGEPLSRIHLAVKGGRKAGFRTWSKQPISRFASGTYRCEVKTALGQTLGITEVEVRKR